MCLNCCLADDAVGLKEGVDSYGSEDEEDDCCYDCADASCPLKPDLVVPADGLKHAPEAVCKVEPYGYEPYDVDCEYPPGAEGGVKKNVRIFCVTACEFLKLQIIMSI